MVGYGITEITRREPDLKARLPHFTPLIAALLCHGYRLLPPPLENHQDIVIGCEHLQDFKRARTSKLDRMITFRFVAARRIVAGESLGVEAFAERCESDPVFVTMCQNHPHFMKWHMALCEKLLAATPAVMAIQGGRHAVLPMGNRSTAEKRSAFARMFEEGW